jgi:hypothetical protein
VDDDALQRRLDEARGHVAEQRERLRAARRRLRELEAAASARSDRATVQLLRARGCAAPSPPVPAHPPDWLSEPDSTTDDPDGRPTA